MKEKTKILFILSSLILPLTVQAKDDLKSEIDKQANEIMKTYDVPGMSIAVSVDGKSQIFNYGFANKEKQQPVTNNTIFELGSMSKTFAAIMISYAEQKGALSLDDKVDNYIPALKGSRIGDTSLKSLATYTAGGLPLQFPDEVTNYEEMISYYREWKGEYPSDTKRLYSNVSIGLAAYIAALSLHDDYSNLLENKIFPSLKMSNTFVNVPESKMEYYAYGYNSENNPVRVNPGMLDAEAYGIKSTTTDLIKYMDVNMNTSNLSGDLKSAIDNTKKGYYKASTFSQGLAWEMYPYPVSIKSLLEGNSTDTIVNPQPISQPDEQNNGWMNKTGSTGGFGTYIAYIPREKVGVIILANKYYPNDKRVKAAYAILKEISK